RGNNLTRNSPSVELSSRASPEFKVAQVVRFPRLHSTFGVCGFAVASVTFGCLLLVLNGGVVAAVYFALAESGPLWMRNRSLAQFALFVGPVLLLVLEWALIDLVSRQRHGETHPAQRSRNAHRPGSTKD